MLDSFLHIARIVADNLGCRGLDAAVIALKDKAKVVSLVPEFSPRSLIFSRKSPDHKGLIGLLSASSLNGIIIKPRFAAGSLGFIAVSEPDELERALEFIQAIFISEHLCPDLWIAQERVSGELVSCEGYVINGIPKVLGFTGATKLGNTQSRSYFPYDGKLTESARKCAYNGLEALVDRSSFRNGYFHTEFLVDGPVAILIDSNFGRLGGGSIGDHLALSSGLDPVEVFKHFIAVTLFGQQPFEFSSQMMKIPTTAYLYGVASGSELLELTVPPPGIASRHTRILGDGASVPQMGGNNWAWIGILTGPSDQLDQDMKYIRVRTENGWISTVY